MATPNDPWNPTTPTSQGAFRDLALRSARAAAQQAARVGSDVNAMPPIPAYDPTSGLLVYGTAPVPVKQMFMSPLAQKGPYATGAILPNQPGPLRQIFSGWGDPLPANIPGIGASNQALDFYAALNEPVYAGADGTVRFVGFQSKAGAYVTVDGPKSDVTHQQILNSDGEVVGAASAGDIGYNGIGVWIGHTGDFQGYQSEYYRLADVVVANGAQVTQGQLIGHVGNAGGVNGWALNNLELRFQVALVSGGIRALVPPTAFVPNAYPGHLDSTNANNATVILMPLVAAVGGQVIASRAANIISSLNRATTIENKSVADVKQDQSDHAMRTAQTINVQQTSIYAAAAGFQGQPPQVSNPMTFDFQTGLWNDGNPT
jgi:murein DD-endopeptidase MepM/ murein hydrolase activator NlpD